MGSDRTSILYECEDQIAMITLNRPERLNAVTHPMIAEYIDVLRRADCDDDVRVILVTGAGRGFCAGQDLEEKEDPFDHRGDPGVSAETHRDAGGQLALAVFELRKPVIAAVNGPAVGFGVTMTLPMDIRIASEAARFGFVFARRGLVPDACATYFLPRIVGISRAAEWVYSGRVFPAREALEAGLVSRVVRPSDLLPTARSLAAEIAENTSAVSVALSRQMLWRLLGAGHPMEAHRLESKAFFTLGGAEDAEEGVRSFLEKRPPKFRMSPSADMPEFYPWWEDVPFRVD